MKVFHWVHGRFCNSKVAAAGRLSGNGSNAHFVGEDDTNNWKGGLILRIGTLLLRYEPLTNDDDVGGGGGKDINEVSNYFEGGGNNGGKFEYVRIEKSSRTTLADLFSAENDNNVSYWDYLEEEKKKKVRPQPQPHINKVEIIKEKEADNSKHRQRRKKLPAAEDGKPIPKLHQLMRRLMWTRKIHPDSCKDLEKNNSEALLLHESSKLVHD